MIAVDTNILVYAAHSDSPWHAVAKRRVTELAEDFRPWAVPWPCLHEFYSVMTNPRLYKRAMSPQQAVMHLDLWRNSPSLRLIGESPKYWDRLKTLLNPGAVVGPMIHDARIAAICIEHGVEVLWTADRDFQRFPALKTVNPLITT